MMRRCSWLNLRLRYLALHVAVVWAALIFAGPATAQQSCSFVYYNPYAQSGGPKVAATPEAACSLANWSITNSSGDVQSDTFNLGALISGSPSTNNAAYTCPGYNTITPSDPSHCQWYGGGCRTTPVVPPTVTEVPAYPQYTSVNTCPQYFAEDTPPPVCEACSENAVGHPINPALGNVFSTEADVQCSSAQSAIGFKRFYNSADVEGADHVPGWRHSYDQAITTVTDPPVTFYPTNGTASPQYATQSDACQLGFAAIRSNVSAWANVTASYSNGTCVLSNGSTTIGTLPLFSTALGAASSSASEYDAIREDGQIVRFTLQGGILTAPQGTSLRLTKSASGFTLTDDQDNVETYNSSGVLLSIASRSGVVQTLSYDTSGSLSAVNDSFGNSLTVTRNVQGSIGSITLNGGATVNYSYNAQGVLTAVTNLDGTTRSYTYGG